MNLFDFIGSAVCHQMAERSFIWGDLQSPVCARCTGIEAGLLFGTVFFLLAGRQKGNRPFSFGSSLLAGLSFLPIAVDGVGSYLGFWASNNLLRVVTGAMAGYGLPGLFLLAANFQPGQRNDSPIYARLWEQAGLLALTLVYGLLVWLGWLPYGTVAVITALGVICFYGGFVFLLLRLLAGKREWPFLRLSALGGLCLVCLMGGLVG
ncbi:DUF2085 domain-containing protein [Anaerotignum lactatifermentans]|uniref:DUF2085 domain-containing protein n=1 Tax=Anaerotignum lactatifermentans TaxID=160404 RepID=A0ABS2G8X8_9FIRM|nr:DUF2085 domain-containing protein [Anaerotignum lactatifermentans]MBM6828781.1 DUF2085 domain-containing protein [Anaerotignum lactatifermentans]MBM6877108.1 DUF2085 domain-containing protein [Anaerotignum lactatifermentans]MBM6950363.1 DUF2085 domain-containing protein [Anaerotignum lactatifermentans]